MKDETNRVLRDELAGLMPQGWTQIDSSANVTFSHWVDKNGDPCLDAECEFVHPIPNDLTTAAACLPDGWYWIRRHIDNVLTWTGCPGPALGGINDIRHVTDTGNEISDRFALALACRKAVTPSRSEA